MKAKETNLLKFLQGPKQFLIPIFQRPYSWEEAHCRQLWDDLLRVADDDKGHFLGSVVYIEKDIYSISGLPQLLVIDGQQRLTSLALLLSALGRAVKAQGVQIGTTQRRLENYYLFNVEEDGELHYKLLLTRRDKETLICLLKERALPLTSSSRLVENYHFFASQLKKADLEAVYMGIQKLVIVDIALERGRDNPQLIFESLNSTGLDLSQADLIRNYVLMGQEPKLQTQLYLDYWYPMEQSFGEKYTYHFDRFMRHYLTLKTGRISNIQQVYGDFKTYVESKHSPQAIQTVVADIYHYSKHYINFALLGEKEAALRIGFTNLSILKVEVAYPFLLEVYEDYIQGVLNREELIELLCLVESYVLRRAICGIPTNSLNNTFATLMGQVDKENYLESLKMAFLRLTSSGRLPTDSEFKREFIIKDVYHFRNRNYLLEKIENDGRKEQIKVQNYTCEHVLPQNPMLSKAWQEELGENWQQVQEQYLHTIGNLTLTGYNSELSDRPFKEKRDMPGGFRDSPLRLNRSLARQEVWNEKAILERANELAKLASEIWAFPKMAAELLQVVGRGKKARTLNDYHHLTGDTLDLFQQLRARLLDLDASVTEMYKKLYIAYKVRTNFVDIVPQKRRLRLSLNMAFPKINDPQGWCRDITNVGRWGNGDVEVYLTSPSELDYIMFLIRQAFNEKVG